MRVFRLSIGGGSYKFELSKSEYKVAEQIRLASPLGSQQNIFNAWIKQSDITPEAMQRRVLVGKAFGLRVTA